LHDALPICGRGLDVLPIATSLHGVDRRIQSTTETTHAAGTVIARSQYGHVTRSSGKNHASTLPPQFGQAPTKCSWPSAFSWTTNSSADRSITPLTSP